MNNGNTPKAIKGRKEDLKDFNLEVLAKDIYSAALDIGGRDENKAREMAQVVGQKLYQEYGNITTPDQIEEIKFKTLIERGYEGTAWAGKIRSKRKEKARSNLQVLGSKGKRDSTDSFLMVGSSSRETATGWDRKRIIISLINEANLDLRTAESVSEEVETNLFSGEVPQITTQLIRETAHTELIRRNLREASNLYKNFGMPRADLEQLINNKNKENSNVAGNNPEAINFTIAGGILKAYALSNVFSEDIAEAHTNGALHLHFL